MELQEYLDFKGIKHRHFAKQLGISLSTLHCISKKQTLPNLKLAMDIELLTDKNVSLYDWFPGYKAKKKKNTQIETQELSESI